MTKVQFDIPQSAIDGASKRKIWQLEGQVRKLEKEIARFKKDKYDTQNLKTAGAILAGVVDKLKELGFGEATNE